MHRRLSATAFAVVAFWCAVAPATSAASATRTFLCLRQECWRRPVGRASRCGPRRAHPLLRGRHSVDTYLYDTQSSTWYLSGHGTRPGAGTHATDAKRPRGVPGRVQLQRHHRRLLGHVGVARRPVGVRRPTRGVRPTAPACSGRPPCRPDRPRPRTSHCRRVRRLGVHQRGRIDRAVVGENRARPLGRASRPRAACPAARAGRVRATGSSAKQQIDRASVTFLRVSVRYRRAGRPTLFQETLTPAR